MAKHPFPPFLLDRTKPVSLQKQLAVNLKRLVHAGMLEPGREVPSSRELAFDLKVSRNTVIQAYDRLVGEGYLEAFPRRGLFVSELLKGQSLGAAGAPGSKPSRSLNGNAPESGSGPVPFRPCQPDVRLFPLQLWNRARSSALSTRSSSKIRFGKPVS